MTQDEPWIRAHVKLWDLKKGWGFLERKSGPDVFIHIEELKRLGYVYNLPKGKPVEIQVKESRKGPLVSNIREISPCPPIVQVDAKPSLKFYPPQKPKPLFEEPVSARSAGPNGKHGR